ncbi:MAG: hypothetical protein JJT85_03145, partial [Chromatiales bacterium]|nr:hypothetical protein [Chromatiales bacterium]
MKEPRLEPLDRETEVDALSAGTVEALTVTRQTAEARDFQVAATVDILNKATPRPAEYQDALKTVKAILEGASPDDAAALGDHPTNDSAGPVERPPNLGTGLSRLPVSPHLGFECRRQPRTTTHK